MPEKQKKKKTTGENFLLKSPIRKELQEKTWSKPAVRVGQAKTAQACKKMARQINKTLPTAAETLTAALNCWVQSIKPALATLCENVAAAFSNMAAGLREESEAVEND